MPIPKSKFKKPAASTKAKSGGGKKSRYAGIKASQPGTPRLCVGNYRLRAVRHEEGHNPGTGSESFKCYWEVVESEGEQAEKRFPPGTQAFESFRTAGGGSNIGLEQLKAYVMAPAGYDADEEEAFDEFAGEEGEFFDAMLGERNQYAPDGEDPTVGREFLVEVLRGNPVKDQDGNPKPGDDDYYRNYRFASTAEETGRLVLGEDGCEVEGEA